MPVYKTKTFARIARRANIADDMLVTAHRRVMVGMINADLGSGLLKQRVARKGQGKSGGFRVLLAFRRGTMTVFLYAFAKNERDNLERDELEDWKIIAAEWLAADAATVRRALDAGVLIEVPE